MKIKETLKAIKLHESTISMALGAVIIIIVGALLINYLAGRRSGETIPPIESLEETEGLPSTHVVKEGEDLWQISENYYGTGYNWTDIAQANNISDPNQIEVGQKLTIPNVSPKLSLREVTATETSKEAVEEEKPITDSREAKATIEPEVTPEKEEVSDTSKQVVHTVESGESLWKIAQKYYQDGFKWVEISKENGLENPDLIEIGQNLIIPEIKEETIAKVDLQEPISGATYTVQKGDNLWEIAVRAYGDGYKWVEIAKENKLANPQIIHSGNILSLPH